MNLDISRELDIIQAFSKKYSYDSVPDFVKPFFEKDLLLRLSWNTNSLEGNTLSLEETVEVLEYDEVRSGHTFSEYQEAKNSYHAFRSMLSFTGRKPVDITFIKRTNALFLGGSGEYRKTQVYIGSLAEVSFLPPSPEEIPERMTGFEKMLHIQEDEIGKLVRQIAIIHMRFEMLHPFPDGNGRTGRLLMDQLLLNAGLLPVVIRDRSKYRQAFKRYERNSETILMEYCIAAGIIESYKILEDNCRKLGDPD